MAPVYEMNGGPAECLEGASCALGVFDGVHTGHRYLIERTRACAREADASCVVVTFDRDPDECFRPREHRKLMENADRIELLASQDVDAVVVLPFTREFAHQSPEEFLDACFGRFTPGFLHVGEGFRFGRGGRGTVGQLESWGRERGMACHVHRLLTASGESVSSTRIRTLLSNGDVRAAAQLLGAPYCLREKVLRGRGQGKAMGFATANLQVKPSMRVLGEGVYACYAHIGAIRCKAAVSVGVSPTFAGETDSYCEVHILDFDGNLYDREIRLEFIAWLRPMIRFETTEQLVRTVMGNIEWVRGNL